MSTHTASRIVGNGALVLAVAVPACLGTLGFFAVGFGVMTDCTNNYSCTETGCSPCDQASAWIMGGALAQLVLVVTTVWFGWRSRDSARLLAFRPLVGITVVAVAVATIVLTTKAADSSYCRPGTEGYAESYCEVSALAGTPF